MKVHRFLLENEDFDRFQKGETVRFTNSDLCHQIKRVLRINKGEALSFFNGRGKEILVKLLDYSENFVEVSVENFSNLTLKNKRHITLYAAILKRENFELIVEKVTELGVMRIVPIITNRTIKLNLREDRLKKILKEAAEQCGRADLPELNNAIYFEEALKHSESNEMNLFFTPKGDDLNDFKRSLNGKKNIGVFVGPEGGWDDVELDVAQRVGFDLVSFGPLIFRAETAAIVGVYDVLYS